MGVGFAAMVVVGSEGGQQMLVAVCEGRKEDGEQEVRERRESGRGAVFGEEGEEDEDEDDFFSVGEMFMILEGEYAFLLGALSLSLLLTVLNMALPAAFAGVMTACREKTPLDGAIAHFLTVQGTIIIVECGRDFLMSTLAERVRHRLRKMVYEGMLMQEIAFFDANAKGQLMALMGEDVVRIQQAVTDQIIATIDSLTTICYGTYRVISLSPLATLFVLAAVPLLTLSSVMAQGASRRKAITAYEASRDTAHMATEVLTNARTVQSFSAEEREVVRYHKALDDQYLLDREYRVFTGAAHSVFNALNMALSAGGMWYGGRLVREGRTTVDDLVLFMQYSWRIGSALGGLMHIFGEQQRAVLSAQKIFGIIRRTPLIKRGEGEEVEKIEGLVEFKNLSFAYPTRPETPVIKTLNLSLKPGTVTGLVGGSGNGKSTLAWLLQRFYDPTDGQVLVDGKDVRSLEVKSLRHHIAIVSQEPTLFHGTVADNIRYGCPDATEAQVEAAAAEANCLEFVQKLPKGFQTTVNQVGLSAGQRQRLCIARAILKNPTILILDEATSQLDAKSEAQVQEALDKLIKGRTVLVIAHRLSTIRDADQICVLDEGQVIEKGTHAELMRLKGLYHLMAKRQMQ